MDDETVRTVRQNVFDNFQSNSRYRDFITARDALTAARSLLVRIMNVDETLAETRSLQRQRRGYVTAMPPRRTSKKDSPAKLAGRMKRRWRVVLLRAKGEILGTVEAPDVASAKAAAAVQFDLDEIQRNRIMVQELA